jgi:hypothetical protein
LANSLLERNLAIGWVLEFRFEPEIVGKLGSCPIVLFSCIPGKMAIHNPKVES